MRAIRQGLLVLVVAGTICWAGSAGAVLPTKAQVCEAAKVTASGTKQKCLATERAKEVKGKSFNYAKCDAAFTKAFTNAETKAGGVCPTEGDAAAMEAQIDAAADRLNAALSGATPPATHLFPATGQTTCWNSAGTVIGCTGTGQDGDIQAGATLSYTDNGDGTITDTNTGLMWEKKSREGDTTTNIHHRDKTYTWANAFAVHIAGLNAGAGFAGYTDWRLPNVKELQSIVNYENVNPSVSPAFNTLCTAGCTVTTCSCTAASVYWSSSTLENSPGGAWFVEFSIGVVSVVVKGNLSVVRAVRGGL